MGYVEKVLILGGLLNLVYGFLTGFLYAKERAGKSSASRYLVAAHIGPLMQGTMLLALVPAFVLAGGVVEVEATAAWLFVLSSVLIAAKDTLNYLRGVEDEFQARPVLARVLGTTGVLAGSGGLGILVVCVVQAL